MSGLLKHWTVAGLSVVAVGYVACLPAFAVTVGPVTDDYGVVKIANGEPIQIGSFLALTGADAALGIDAKRGVEIALDERGGRLDGHPIKIEFEDEGCSAEGGQTAASRLASNSALVGVLGSSCSSAALAGVPILWNAKIPAVGVGPTSPALTVPTRGPNFDGFVRVSFNDVATGAFVAKYVVEALKAKTAATVHDGSSYAEQVVRVFEENFKQHGGSITASEAISPTDTDMRPMLTRVAINRPDVLFMPLYVAAGAYMVRQQPEVRGLEKTILVATDPIMAPGFLSAAGKAAIGVQMVGIDFRPETLGPAYQRFVETYKKRNGEAPIAGFHAYGYDATGVLLAAIHKVAAQDANGNMYVGKKALRDALYATKDYDGITGKLTCNQYGDCASPTYAVWQYTSEDPNSYSLGSNPKRIYP
ncbi:MAG: branched-chain amino acid ABC transporter substrate-binding protein [Alphaproteobacteria bacterium]